MKLRSSILAITIVLATAGTAAAAAAPQGALAEPPMGAVATEPTVLTAQIRAAAKGKRQDAKRYQRLMALVRNPKAGVATIQQWAAVGGGAGMAPPEAASDEVPMPNPPPRIVNPRNTGCCPAATEIVTTAPLPSASTMVA